MAKNLNGTQEKSRAVVLRSALKLDAEADIYLPDTGLTAPQWTAIAMMAAGTRQTEIAQALQITPETVSRWKLDVRFSAALNVAIAENYAAIAGRVRDIASEAVEVLHDTMNCDDPKLRLTAALSVLRLHANYGAGVADLPTTPAQVARRELEALDEHNRSDLFAGAFSF